MIPMSPTTKSKVLSFRPHPTPDSTSTGITMTNNNDDDGGTTGTSSNNNNNNNHMNDDAASNNNNDDDTANQVFDCLDVQVCPVQYSSLL